MTNEEQEAHLKNLMQIVEERLTYTNDFKTAELDLSFCNIGELSQDRIAILLRHIKETCKTEGLQGFYLNLNHNGIEKLPDEICSWKKLTGLSLDNNKLTEIPFIQSEQKFFWYLSARNNQLTHVANFNPRSASETSTLDSDGTSVALADNSQSAKLQISELQYLDLYNNKIAQLPPVTIMSLNPSEPEEVKIYSDEFTTLPALRVLNLGRNQIQEFPKSEEVASMLAQGKREKVPQKFGSIKSFIVRGGSSKYYPHKDQYDTGYVQSYTHYTVEEVLALKLLSFNISDNPLTADTSERLRPIYTITPVDPDQWHYVSKLNQQGEVKEPWQDPGILQDLTDFSTANGRSPGVVLPSWNKLLNKDQAALYLARVERQRSFREASKIKVVLEGIQMRLQDLKSENSTNETILPTIETYNDQLQNMLNDIENYSVTSELNFIAKQLEVFKKPESIENVDKILRSIDIGNRLTSQEQILFYKLLDPILNNLYDQLRKLTNEFQRKPGEFSDDLYKTYIEEAINNINYQIDLITQRQGGKSEHFIQLPTVEDLITNCEIFSGELAKEDSQSITEFLNWQEAVIEAYVHPILANRVEVNLDRLLSISESDLIQSFDFETANFETAHIESMSQRMHTIIDISARLDEERKSVVKKRMIKILDRIKSNIQFRESVQMKKIENRLNELLGDQGQDFGRDKPNKRGGIPSLGLGNSSNIGSTQKFKSLGMVPRNPRSINPVLPHVRPTPRRLGKRKP